MSLRARCMFFLLPALAFAAPSPAHHHSKQQQKSSTSSTSSASSTATSATVIEAVAGLYTVSGVGAFTNSATYSFTNGLPNGLSSSDYTVQDTSSGAPYDHEFQSSNVVVSNGVAQLVVPGGQSSSPLKAAEITTDVGNILHASVRTTARFSGVPGTCHGLFFYESDTQEIDIEYLTSMSSLANSGASAPLLQYTNQATTAGGQQTYSTAAAPSDDATTFHEYRIDWIAGATMFYVDGVLQTKYTTNVPTKAGSWVWNNWSNGDIGWSAGPPASDNILEIKEIVMYYNTTSSA